MAPGTARIAVDLLGGDHAPAVVVGGALRACQADPTLQLLLVGPSEVAGEIIGALDPADRHRVSHQFGSDPVRAVVDGAADAVVSAGPTGAIVTAAALGFGRLGGRPSGPSRAGPHGVELRRPALAVVLPTATGKLILLDVGASVDPDAETLAGHALYGAAYAAAGYGLSRARVGLLSIGTEDGKGDRVRRAAAELLKTLPLPAGASYVGLVEGHEAVLGQHADVVVTDGFTGNVLLKGVEAAYSLLGKPAAGPPAGTSTGRPPVGEPGRADPPPRAGLLLGVAGTCVVCHGAATAADIASGISLAARLHRDAVVATLTTMLPDGGAVIDAEPVTPPDPGTGAVDGATNDNEESP